MRCEYLNLVGSEYSSAQCATTGTDLIFCRNVLIYFDQDTVDFVLRRLAESLADGGWLIPGPSDPRARGEVDLEVQSAEWGLYYRRAGGIATGPLRRGTSSRQAPSPVDVHRPEPARPSIFGATALRAEPQPPHVGVFAAAEAACATETIFARRRSPAPTPAMNARAH